MKNGSSKLKSVTKQPLSTKNLTLSFNASTKVLKEFIAIPLTSANFPTYSTYPVFSIPIALSGLYVGNTFTPNSLSWAISRWYSRESIGSSVVQSAVTLALFIKFLVVNSGVLKSSFALFQITSAFFLFITSSIPKNLFNSKCDQWYSGFPKQYSIVSTKARNFS